MDARRGTQRSASAGVGAQRGHGRAGHRQRADVAGVDLAPQQHRRPTGPRGRRCRGRPSRHRRRGRARRPPASAGGTPGGTRPRRGARRGRRACAARGEWRSACSPQARALAPPASSPSSARRAACAPAPWRSTASRSDHVADPRDGPARSAGGTWLVTRWVSGHRTTVVAREGLGPTRELGTAVRSRGAGQRAAGPASWLPWPCVADARAARRSGR